MADKLTQLKALTTVVADTGDIEAIKRYQPIDATTNPSLVLKASEIPEYAALIEDAISWAKSQSQDKAQQIIDAGDKLAVNIGLEVLKIVPGRISTEVDARLSFDTDASIAKARKLIRLYNEAGITNDRILIKLASTWEGIRAAEVLEKEGIQVLVLSGDRPAAVQRVAAEVGIAQAQGYCSPQDKLQRMQTAQAQGHQVAMVGDGLNDGPVLAGAHVSFAFGRSIALAQSRSDFVVLGEQLSLVPQTVLLARRTLRVVRQNLWWAAGYNALSIPLAVVGWMPAWLAGLGMAASSLLVVLNAARLSRGLPDIMAYPTAQAPGAVAQPAWEMA